MRKPLVLLCLLTLVAGCLPEKQLATVPLAGGAEVTMRVRGMFGLHRDWSRTLQVNAPQGSVELALADDTGWWRGSNLYLWKAGVYVLHEGQGGCVQFRIDPPVFPAGQSDVCDRNRAGADDMSSMRHGPMSFGPVSRFYPGLIYLGRFAEGSDKRSPLRFIGADEAPEMELPDIL